MEQSCLCVYSVNGTLTYLFVLTAWARHSLTSFYIQLDQNTHLFLHTAWTKHSLTSFYIQLEQNTHSPLFTYSLSRTLINLFLRTAWTKLSLTSLCVQLGKFSEANIIADGHTHFAVRWWEITGTTSVNDRTLICFTQLICYLWWWWWHFPRVQGFGENFWKFIHRMQFFFFFFESEMS